MSKAVLPELVDDKDHGEAWQQDARGVMHYVYDHCGEMGRFIAHGMDIVMMNSPEAREAFFRAPDEVISEYPASVVMKPILGAGVSYDAPTPEKKKQQFRPAFAQTRYLQTYPPTISSDIDRAIADMGEEGEIDVVSFYVELMLYASASVLVSPEFTAEVTPEFVACFRDLDLSNMLLACHDPHADHPRFHARDRSRARIVQIIEGVLDKRRARGAEGSDMIDRMLQRGTVTADEMTNLLVSILFAAHDTMSTSLAWATVEAARHPEHVADIRAEVDPILAASSKYDYNTLRDMTVTESFIKEALRVHVPIPFLIRRTEQDFHYKDWVIPAHHYIGVAPALAHLDPICFPQPEKFDPSRYAEGREEDRQGFDWLPFGSGRHRCVGQPLALMMMKIVMSKLLHRFDIALGDGPVETDSTTMTQPPIMPCMVRYQLRQR